MLGKHLDDLHNDDLNVIISSELDTKGLIHTHLSTFNDFAGRGIDQIVEDIFQVELNIKNERDKTPEDREIEDITCTVKFSNVNVGRPITSRYETSMQHPLYPSLARTHNLTYSGRIDVDAEIEAKAFLKGGKTAPRVRTDSIKGLQIATIPVMVRSEKCHTYGLSRAELQAKGEDPLDEGGYYIIKGNEWTIDNIESRKFNDLHGFKNVGHLNELARGEFISKPGDAFENSKRFILFYLNNRQIVCEITAPNFSNVRIPFYIIFRLMGMIKDKEIIDNIVYGYGSLVSDNMVQILLQAMNTPDPIFGRLINERSRAVLINEVASILAQQAMIGSTESKRDEKQENLRKYLQSNLVSSLDIHLLPHVGMDNTSRLTKMRYLGYLIHRLLLIDQEIILSTDRDSLDNKRINPAGLSYAKVFKTQFNLAVIQTMRKKLKNAFQRMPFSEVPLASTVKVSVNAPDLERALEQAITSGNKEITIKNKQVANRLASQNLHRKNQLNLLSTLRTIRTPSSSSSKADVRAKEMRQVHSTFIGYIDPIHSAHTGESVGLVKQMSIGASVCGASSSLQLTQVLLEDPDVIPLAEKTPNDMYKEDLSNILVNGNWIGYTKSSHALVSKYRELRRESLRAGGGVNPMTTIHWDVETNEVHFWVDAGRIVRPLLIVRNNIDNPEMFGHKADTTRGAAAEMKFAQDIVLQKEDVKKILAGEINIETLHKLGVVEYVSAEEQMNCQIAYDLDCLKDARSDPTVQYTHCEIPASIFGIVSLTTPFLEHSQIVRVVYQVSQANQTCGWATLNYPYRVDKDAFMQIYCEKPLVKTFTSKYTYPNGMNVVLAIACYNGYNQEDSKIANQAILDRGMFLGFKSLTISSELDKGEQFQTPSESNTLGIKPDVSYEHLVDATVREGTIVRKKDVIIGKVEKLSNPTDHFMFKDRSVTYPYDEPAIVEKVIPAYNQEMRKVITVKLKALRPPNIGDKFSSRSGQKGVISKKYRQSDMPFTASGIIIDLIMNPHAIPSRMTIGQLIETLMGKVSAEEGSINDATMGRKVSVEELATILEAMGMERYGYEVVYHGQTGEAMDCEIFVGPTFYQRLQKFTIDEVYAMFTGRTEAMTRQYMEGRARLGGLRIGEMEKDCFLAHGAVSALNHKFTDDSDKFDMFVCRNCGQRAIVNERRGLYSCKICLDDADIVKIKSAWTSNMFLEEIESSLVGVRTPVTRFEYDQHI